MPDERLEHIECLAADFNEEQTVANFLNLRLALGEAVTEIHRLRGVVDALDDFCEKLGSKNLSQHERIAELEATQEELLALSGATDSEEAKTLPTSERLEIAIRSLRGANSLLRSHLEDADGVIAGLKDVVAGRVVSHEEVKAETPAN